MIVHFTEAAIEHSKQVMLLGLVARIWPVGYGGGGDTVSAW